MSAFDLHNHLQSGVTTVARAWRIRRVDGLSLGFTDHDMDIHFDGTNFSANTGMSAKEIHHSLGLSIDNSEAMGAFSDTRITKEDINAGLYDSAQICGWLVNWTDVQARKLIFKGHIGDIRRNGALFEVELRGLSDTLNQVRGRVFQKQCAAVLGDAACGFDITQDGYSVETKIEKIKSRKELCFKLADSYAADWFTHGHLKIISGAGASIIGWIKQDRSEDGLRCIELWEDIRAQLAKDDKVLLNVGCDKQLQTCKSKFNNIKNFQGFPYLPGDDWMMSVPSDGNFET